MWDLLLALYLKWILLAGPLTRLNPCDLQSGPVAGSTPVQLPVDIDNIAYKDVLVQVLPIGNDCAAPDPVSAEFNPDSSCLLFKTPEINKPVVCHFSIALDGHQFVAFTDDSAPRFVYYGAWHLFFPSVLASDTFL